MGNPDGLRWMPRIQVVKVRAHPASLSPDTRRDMHTHTIK